MLKEDLKDLIIKLNDDKTVIELVKIMKPLDIVAVITKDLDLCDNEAKFVTKCLLQHAYESLNAPSIETNKQFPVPAQSKKESYGNYTNATPTYVIKRYHFPPDPLSEPSNWPFDDMTVSAMDPDNRSPKRPLMNSVDNDFKIKKSPFSVNLKLNQPGSAGFDSGGTYMKNSPHNPDNSTSTSGASWDLKGTPGWSSTPPGKEFDLPDDADVMKPSPVGSSIPLFKGGRNPGRRMGFMRR